MTGERNFFLIITFLLLILMVSGKAFCREQIPLNPDAFELKVTGAGTVHGESEMLIKFDKPNDKLIIENRIYKYTHSPEEKIFFKKKLINHTIKRFNKDVLVKLINIMNFIDFMNLPKVVEDPDDPYNSVVIVYFLTYRQNDLVIQKDVKARIFPFVVNFDSEEIAKLCYLELFIWNLEENRGGKGTLKYWGDKIEKGNR